MAREAHAEADQVSPLELFFDLVFVFAVSQLSHHLREHLSWRGVAETVVMLIAVFGVWSYTSWGSTLPGIRRATYPWTILSVTVVSLFMNAGVGRAFDDEPWLFVVPFLLCRIGPALLWLVTSTQLRDHYAAPGSALPPSCGWSGHWRAPSTACGGGQRQRPSGSAAHGSHTHSRVVTASAPAR